MNNSTAWKIYLCLLTAALASVLEVRPSYAETKPIPSTGKKVVLVELFTSEGCSSCPPADKNLIALQAQPIAGIEIVTLSEHVTYWNYLGWSDPFSQEIFSQRQRQLASKIRGSSVYTPQMVIDGKTQIIGSDYWKALAAIKQAARAEKEELAFDVQKRSPLHLTLSGTATTQQKQTSCIAAVVEDGLLSQVKSGENSGEHLKHDSVVREWLEIGSASVQKPLHFKRDVAISNSWNLKNVRVVLFLQTPTGETTALAQTGINTR